MKAITTVKLEKSKLQLMTRSLKPKAMKILDKGAFEIAGEAVERVRVDTGATKASIYVEGASGSPGGYDYHASMLRAAKLAEQSGRRPNMWFTPPARADDEWTRVIGASTWYAEIVEFVHEAFLLPAALIVKPRLIKMWENLFKW